MGDDAELKHGTPYHILKHGWVFLQGIRDQLTSGWCHTQASLEISLTTHWCTYMSQLCVAPHRIFRNRFWSGWINHLNADVWMTKSICIENSIYHSRSHKSLSSTTRKLYISFAYSVICCGSITQYFAYIFQVVPLLLIHPQQSKAQYNLFTYNMGHIVH